MSIYCIEICLSYYPGAENGQYQIQKNIFETPWNDKPFLKKVLF